MCHTKSAPPSVIRRKEKRSDASLKTSRKSRTKRRRPKYKSLSLKLNPDHQKNQNSVKKLSPPSSSSSKITNKKKKKPQKMVNKTQKGKKEEEEELEEDNKRLIDLFPIRLRNLIPAVEEEDYGSKSDMQEVASFLFDSATDSTATLNGILSSTTTTVTTPSTTAASEECPLSSSLMMTYAYGGHDIGGDEEGIDGGKLVRTAMRRRRRDENEERWVSYNEVVEKKATMTKTVKKRIKKEKEKEKVIKEEEVVSRSSDRVGTSAWGLMDEQQGIEGGKNGGLSLKLDYQEIMDAWSDKGPLYVDGEAPQIVPDLQVPNVMKDTWDNLWTVPDMANNRGGNSSKTNEDESGGKECWKKEHREASMLRYKEKRQNRLFSKRIRYEVRRLNAEKRPRIKGRFVKRSSETRRRAWFLVNQVPFLSSPDPPLSPGTE